MPGIPPQKLADRHRLLMRELAAGRTLTQAAEAVGITVSRASIIANSELFQEELARLRNKVEERFVESEGEKQSLDYHRRFQSEIDASIDTLIRLRDSAESEAVQQKSALEILNRAGVRSPTEVEASVNIELGEGVEAMLKEALRTLGK